MMTSYAVFSQMDMKGLNMRTQTLFAAGMLAAARSCCALIDACEVVARGAVRVWRECAHTGRHAYQARILTALSARLKALKLAEIGYFGSTTQRAIHHGRE